MAEKIHPSHSSPPQKPAVEAPPPPSQPPTPSVPAAAPPPPKPSTYVIQIPKDQIYKYPSQENAQRYQKLSNPQPRRSCCRSCCIFTLCFLLLFIISAATAAGVLYLIFRPESPDYTVSGVAIKGLNLTSSKPILPEFNVSVRANNPNNKLGIYYLKGSKVEIYYGETPLSNGVLPVFDQKSNNVTVLHVILNETDLLLGNAVKSTLRSQQSERKVPFVLKLKAPVKFKIGSVKSWKFIVKVKCDIVVDSLTEKSNIVSKECGYDVRLW
ncbi:hypothetical protein Leryth_004942 [Lithospermum erythrorhizon]|nr:hypothetical protein Leryth_004942 [Lithospermum erythrorhizon]